MIEKHNIIFLFNFLCLISAKGNQHDTCIQMLAEANMKTKQVAEKLNRLTLENSELKELKV